MSFVVFKGNKGFQKTQQTGPECGGSSGYFSYKQYKFVISLHSDLLLVLNQIQCSGAFGNWHKIQDLWMYFPFLLTYMEKLCEVLKMVLIRQPDLRAGLSCFSIAAAKAKSCWDHSPCNFVKISLRPCENLTWILSKMTDSLSQSNIMILATEGFMSAFFQNSSQIKINFYHQVSLIN